MVQPYDYTLKIPAPGEAFMSGIQLGQQQSQIEAQRARAEAEREEARLAREKAIQMDAALKDYTTAPTPQKLANLYLNYPVLKESLNAYTQTLSDADKKTTTEFATQAFGLNRAGKTDKVLSLFDTYIKAANESGRSDMAKVLTDSKNNYTDIEDPSAREALIGSVLAGTGKDGLDLYKNIWASDLDLDTSVIKNIVALGYKVGTPEFQAELRKQMDKVTITRTDGTFIQGTPEQIRDVLGQGGGKVLPRVSTLEEAKRLPPGTEFIGPDGKPYRVPSKGGQTGSLPSGTFQGQ